MRGTGMCDELCGTGVIKGESWYVQVYLLDTWYCARLLQLTVTCEVRLTRAVTVRDDKVKDRALRRQP